MSDPVEPGEVFARLNALLHARPEAEAIYQAIVTAAVSLVRGCDHAALMLRDVKGRYYTAAATDDVALAVDDLELVVEQGPCIDAILDESVQHDPDLTDGSAWPALTERVLAETPVRGMMGFRLLLDGEKVGALDLFSDTAGALDTAAADEAAVLASFAAVAVMTVRAQQQADNLERALSSNREIGKAVGLLMSAHHVADDQAFEILRRTSQNLNVKLSTLAQQIVEGQRVQYVADKSPRPAAAPGPASGRPAPGGSPRPRPPRPRSKDGHAGGQS